MDKTLNEIGSVYGIVTDKLQGWLQTSIEMLPNIAVAILVIFIFGIIARIIYKVSYKGLDKLTNYKAVNRLIARMFMLLILFVGIFTALDVLKLEKTVTSLLAGAGIIGLALGFAFQDLATNLISGIMIAFRKPYEQGHVVDVSGHFGTVRKINLRSTELQSQTGEIIIIPNKNIFQNSIINHSKPGEHRIDLEVGISYGDDLEKVKNITLNAVKDMKDILHQKGVEFYYTGYGDSSINFVLRFWVLYSSPKDYFAPKSEAIMRIKKAYDENDVTIPFPIRTLDFGIKGGEKLDAMIEKNNLKPEGG